MILLKWIRAFGLFWYDFIVGDDWLLAVGVIVALGLTALIAHVAKAPSWWLLPVAVLGVLTVSTLRAGRKVARAAAARAAEPDASAEEPSGAGTSTPPVATPPVQSVTAAAEQPTGLD